MSRLTNIAPCRSTRPRIASHLAKTDSVMTTHHLSYYAAPAEYFNSLLRLDSSGNLGLGTATPTSKLQVRGDVILGPNGQYYAAAGEQKLRIICSRLHALGVAGAGYSATRTSTGHWTVTFTTPFISIFPPIVTATTENSADL